MNNNGQSKMDLNWLLDDIVRRVVGAQHAVVLSSDGLLMGKSGALSKDDSDQLSAIASSLQSLAKGVSRHFVRGPVLQTIIELAEGYLFVSAAGQGACLAVIADASVDVESIAYEMSRLVKTLGDHLSAAPRDPSTNGSNRN
jgi:predicted regulator of Ras-like GTPase activity (Roadblock/LC7/MglB family)